MKYIIFLLLFFVVIGLSQAGIEYTYPTTGADSLGAVSDGPGGGFYRSGYKMGVSTTGNLFLIYKHRSAPQRATNILKTNDWGINWSSDSLITGAYIFANEIYCFGDSCFIVGAKSTYSPVIKKYLGMTGGILDTVGSITTSYTSENRIGFNVIGSHILIVNRTASAQYQWALSAGELTQSTVWNLLGESPSQGEGLCSPFRWTGGVGGALIAYDWGNKYLYSVDSLIGLDTLMTNFIPYSTGSNFMGWMITLHDSTGLFAYQTATTIGADSLNVKKFRVDSVGTGTSGNGTGKVTILDTTLIESHASIFTGWMYQPTLSSIEGTDTVFIFYLYQSDTLNVDSLDICYKMSVDGGLTWGSRQILKPAIKGKKIWDLQSPPTLYSAANIIKLVVAYTDSTVGATGNDQDHLNVYIENLTYGNTQSLFVISRDTVSISIEDSYSGGTNIDTIWMFYDDDSTIAGADSVYNATSLGSPDTLTLTGLLKGTRYWFWGVFSDDNGRDTSLSSNTYTYPSGILSVSIDSVKNDYSGELDSVGIIFTTGNSANGDYVIAVLSSVNYQDSSYVTYRDSVVYPGASITDTIYITDFSGTESWSCYISIWNRSINAGYSSRKSATRDYIFHAPDNHDLFKILRIISLDPDTIEIAIGAVDSTDYDSTIIRWDTTAIPYSVTSGYSLSNMGIVENDTLKFTLGIVQPDWGYFKIFAGDSVNNWSTGVVDSIYFPKTNATGGFVNKMFNYLMGRQGD